MVLVLIIGDLHIPHRTHDLPAKFKKLLVPGPYAALHARPVHSLMLLGPGKIQKILCTGNVSDRETYEWLRTVAVGGDVAVVRGDYDEVRTPSARLYSLIHRFFIVKPLTCMANRLTCLAVCTLAAVSRVSALPDRNTPGLADSFRRDTRSPVSSLCSCVGHVVTWLQVHTLGRSRLAQRYRPTNGRRRPDQRPHTHLPGR